MRIYFVRHGEPNYELDCLTELGKYQAEETSKHLKDLPIERIYASDHGRAVETASFTANKLNLDIIKCPWAEEAKAWQEFAIEYNGKYNWLIAHEYYRNIIFDNENNEKWYKNPVLSKTKAKQGMDRIDHDVDEWLKSMNIIHDRKNKVFNFVGETQKTIALFAHGGMGMAFFPSILDELYPRFNKQHKHTSLCGVTVIDIEDKKPAVLVSYDEIHYDQSLFKKNDKVGV